jgi:hypothetical protein
LYKKAAIKTNSFGKKPENLAIMDIQSEKILREFGGDSA